MPPPPRARRPGPGTSDGANAPSDEVLDLPTPSGPARAHLATPAGRPTGLAVVGHGAGGGVETPDLLAVRGGLLAAGWLVARVEQPYRVAGRRAPAPAPRLDEAWTAVVVQLRTRPRVGRLPLVVAGRSSGARVACRTADVVGADGVLALAFPLHPPGRPDRSRADELLSPACPRLVVQGERDPFGSPDEVERAAAGEPGIRVLVVTGADHSLRRGIDVGAVTAWAAEAPQRSAGAQEAAKRRT